MKKHGVLLTVFLISSVFSAAVSATDRASSLLGKRYFSFSYGTSTQANIDSQISIARLTMNVPLSRNLDIGFGSLQGWGSFTTDSVATEQRHYAFFSNLRYHFLPNHVINPFVAIEMGQTSADISTSTSRSADPLSSTSILLGGEHTYDSTYSDFDFYYSASVGEEFLFSDKFSCTGSYTMGQLDQQGFQYLTASSGYWVLRDFFLESRLRFHFDTRIHQIHLIGNVRF